MRNPKEHPKVQWTQQLQGQSVASSPCGAGNKKVKPGGVCESLESGDRETVFRASGLVHGWKRIRDTEPTGTTATVLCT